MGGSLATRIIMGLLVPEAAVTQGFQEDKQKKEAADLEKRRAVRLNQRSLGALYGGVQGTIGTSNVGVPDAAKTQQKTLLGS